MYGGGGGLVIFFLYVTLMNAVFLTVRRESNQRKRKTEA